MISVEWIFFAVEVYGRFCTGFSFVVAMGSDQLAMMVEG